MKRVMVGVVCGLIIGLLVGTLSLATAGTPIKLLINGKYIQCDTPPQNINGRVFVPARFVAEPLGATVTWDSANQTVVINGSGQAAPTTTGSSDTAKKQPPVTVEELPYELTINPPDSIGNVYMDATYKNNSKKSIVGFEMTVLLKDKNEKVYLMCYDTILPGGTSSKFNTFGPKTQNKNDIEILKYTITVANSDGSKTYIKYDPKLKTYDW